MKNRPAADLLSQLLPAAQDAAEMRRLCETLLSVSDDYRPYCINAAREMYDRLMREQKDANANASEIRSMRSILLQLLQDREFAVGLMKQKAWCKENGKVDSDLLLLSHEVLHDSIVPYCYEAMLYQQENHKEIDPFLAGIAQEYIAYPQASEIVLNSLKSIVSPSGRYQFVISLFPIDEDFGGKTGYTMKAKRTLVTAAQNGNKKIIVVTFNDCNDFNDHLFFYNKFFKEYNVENVCNNIPQISDPLNLYDGFSFEYNDECNILLSKEEYKRINVNSILFNGINKKEGATVGVINFALDKEVIFQSKIKLGPKKSLWNIIKGWLYG